MKEAPKIERAERKFLLDISDPEFAVTALLDNPASFLSELRTRFFNQFEGDESLDPSDPFENPVVEAQVVLEELVGSILELQLECKNELLKEYVNNEHGHTNGGKAFFSMLRQAGYTKNEIKLWIDYDHSDLESIERFEIRKNLAVLDRVYG